MAINDISLTAGMRSNLLSLQSTVALLDRTQSRLSSGKKVNTAMDNPVSYFAAQALNSRAAIIDGLKDSMGQAVQTITSADKGISGLTAMIEQAKGIAQSALSAAAGTAANQDLTHIDTYGTVSLDTTTITSAVTASITVAIGANVTLGTSTVVVGGSTFTYATTVGTGLFATTSELKTLIEALTGYTVSIVGANVTGAVLTITHAGITVGSVTGTVTNAGLVSADVTGTSITFTNGSVSVTLTASAATWTTAGGLATALLANGFNTATVSGTSVIAGKTTTTVLHDDFTINAVGGINATSGTRELRTFTVGTTAFTYTEGTSYTLTAGVAAPTAAIGAALAAAITGAGLGTASVTGTTVAVTLPSSELTSLQTQYNALRTQMDALAVDSQYKGKNLLDLDELVVKFEGTNLTVTGFNASTTGLGINAATWVIGGSIEASVTALDTAATTLRTESSKLSGNLSIITVRQTFSTNMINTLNEGSDKLTLADTNEEGANMLMLQTRQSLGTTALSLSAQAAQSVLRLFQ